MGSDKSSCEINQQSLPLNELSSDATPRGPTSSSRSKASNTESSIQDTTPNTARSFTGIDWLLQNWLFIYFKCLISWFIYKCRLWHRNKFWIFQWSIRDCGLWVIEWQSNTNFLNFKQGQKSRTKMPSSKQPSLSRRILCLSWARKNNRCSPLCL